MHSLEEIKSPVKEHLEEFEGKFRAAMKSHVPLLDVITRYILKRKGKQMRPLFVFLTADLCGKINKDTHVAASLIELLHTATLVHDDVVDDANERRGFFSIKALWKNKIAVLVGDYLLSKGLLLSIDHDRFDLLRIVSEAARQMSEGELLQIEKARRLDIREDIYMAIITQKTASLIASCCAAGATSVNAGAEVIGRMKQFGEYAGIAFQIKDDLFDYDRSNSTGKPANIDIREQKMTLPLIYLLNNSGFLEKRKIINLIKNHHNEPDKVEQVIGMVKASGGLEYAREKMRDFSAKALDLLHEFPDHPSRTALRQLVNYTIERKR